MNNLVRPNAAVWSASFQTPDEMAAAQRDARLEYHSLGYRADYAARLTLVDLGPLWFQDARDAPFSSGSSG